VLLFCRSADPFVEAIVTEPTAHERREIHYGGWVQGVGFRYTARRIAAGHNVRGYVRNLRDGRVQLVVEAAPQEIERYLAELAQTMARYIDSVDVQTGEATGEFVGFDIRF
jgi:acylphosphatase